MCIIDFCRQVPTAQRVQLQPVSQQQLQLQSAGGRAQIITAQPISFATTPRAATTVNAVAGGSAGWSAVPQKRPLDYYYEEPRYCASAKLWYYTWYYFFNLFQARKGGKRRVARVCVISR